MANISMNYFEGSPQELQKEITRLQAEVENLTQERDRLAKDALTALAGVVCTPVEGFVQVPGELKSGILELRGMYEKAQAEVEELGHALSRFRKYEKSLVEALIKEELRAEKAEKERDELRAYADKLADSLPEGKLPKDVELQIVEQARQEAARECARIAELHYCHTSDTNCRTAIRDDILIHFGLKKELP